MAVFVLGVTSPSYADDGNGSHGNSSHQQKRAGENSGGNWGGEESGGGRWDGEKSGGDSWDGGKSGGDK